MVEMQNVVQKVKVEIPPRFYWDDTDLQTIGGRLGDDQGTIRGRLREHLRLAEALGRRVRSKQKQLNNNHEKGSGTPWADGPANLHDF